MLNALNDTAEESIRSEVYNAATVGQANIFIDPRRAMLSVRMNLGRDSIVIPEEREAVLAF